jgi:hypothetical protein
MPFRTWAKVLGASSGVAALAGASQLGLAYGLGILRLTRVLDVTTRDQWTAQLAWVAWLAMISAVAGALAGRMRLPQAGTGFRIVTAVAAGLGAAVTVPLTMQPARTAQVAGVEPVFVIGACAGLGALIGVVAAYAAISQPVARWSLLTVGGAVWVIALVAVAPSLTPSDPLPAVRLGVFDAGFLSPAATQRAALFTMPALALISGALLGWAARRRESPTATIALAGLAGPALLTLAYLIAGPGAGPDRYQVVPYWAAMTAAGAGVLGSVLAAVLRRGPVGDDGQPGGPAVGEPTPDRPPLPKRDAQQESAIAKAARLPQAEEPRPDDTGVFAAFTPAQGPLRAEPQPMNRPPVAPPPVMPPPQAPPPAHHGAAGAVRAGADGGGGARRPEPVAPAPATPTPWAPADGRHSPTAAPPPRWAPAGDRSGQHGVRPGPDGDWPGPDVDRPGQDGDFADWSGGPGTPGRP